VADLLIQRTSGGVALVRTTDPFDSLEVHRIDRASWQQTPQAAGVYLLYGFPNGDPTAYIGMSETDIRARVKAHHVTPQKNWFGVLFAVPVINPMLARAVEAELIQRAVDADVVALTNKAEESRFAGLADGPVDSAVEKIAGALEMLLGTDIFTSRATEEPESVEPALARVPQLARVYRGGAEPLRPRRAEDPTNATHAYVAANIDAWGRFEGAEPDPRFRVLAGSSWREPTLDPTQASYKAQQRAKKMQDDLVSAGVMDPGTKTFAADHVFDNWTHAVVTVAGKGQYSGGRNWQRIDPPGTG
jgi:hypothetical protein